MKTFKTIVTIGPSMLDEEKLKKVNALGECIFRINGAHADARQAAELIDRVRNILPDADLMIDLPGNKVRTANLTEPIRLVNGETITLYDNQVNFREFYTFVNKGDIVRANDSVYTLEVVGIEDSTIKLLSHSDGLLLTNKGLHVRGIHQDIPFLFDRDKELIDVACTYSISHLALSFVRNVQDVLDAKSLITNNEIHIISKIETKSAVENIESILNEVDTINVDRGDLSTEIDILELANYQQYIIDKGLAANKNVILATQFLKNMETKPIALIPEIIDLCRTVQLGITGIQLSEETAVGKYPVECVRLIFDAVKANITDQSIENKIHELSGR